MLQLPIERPAQRTGGRGDAMAAFHPAIAEWFGRRFPEGPTEPQAQGWPLIASGADTLIAAPTGSGKTLAGFLVAIDSLYRAHDAGQDVGAVTRVVYVSPLKALAVDIAENLERPLAEIAAVATELGLVPPAIRATSTSRWSCRMGSWRPSRRPSRWLTCSTRSRPWSASTARRWCSSTPAAWPSGWPTSWGSGWATTWWPHITAACPRSVVTGSRPGCGPVT